jgi:hypothetical protein
VTGHARLWRGAARDHSPRGRSARAGTIPAAAVLHRGKNMPRNGFFGHNQPHLNWSLSEAEERRVRDSIFLPRLTVGDGEWLRKVLPHLQGRAHAAAGAVRVEDIALRYRSGRLGVADALDATAELLAAWAAAGADLDRRSEWSVADDDDEDDDDVDDDDEEEQQPARLEDEPDEDLLVSLRVVVDAAADDAGSAALHWAALALSGGH